MTCSNSARRMDATMWPSCVVEQLYPLADGVLRAHLEPYDENTPVIWVQEEPMNMGAWPALYLRFGSRLLDRFPFSCVSRRESASPATGSHATHKREQQELVERRVPPNSNADEKTP